MEENRNLFKIGQISKNLSQKKKNEYLTQLLFYDFV